MLDKFAKPGSLVAIVSDSYDLVYAVKELWGKELRDQVIKSGATVIIRPDSGYPPEIVRMTLNLLGKSFGYTTNSKGYKVLKHVRVIQGDGINQDSINEILRTAVDESKWSATNIAFGMGGALLQQVNRDTQKFAFKCSAIEKDGKIVPVSKNPKTDPGKKSKAGRMALVHDGEFKTIRMAPDQSEVDGDLLKLVFKDGEIVGGEVTLAQIRAIADAERK